MRRTCKVPWLAVFVRGNVASLHHVSSKGMPQVTQDVIRERARHIRRQELFRRWCRGLIIPCFTCYGLFILRPTEGHFLRYLAERRHYDAAFAELFPPITDTNRTSLTNSEGGGDRAGTATRTAKRTRDDTWLQRRFRSHQSDDEERRVERLRRLFAHGIDSPTEGDNSVDGAVDRCVAEHTGGSAAPPVYIISEQLQQMLEESKRYREQRPDTHNAPPPTVEITFHDRLLYATATLTFHRADGQPVMQLNFLGACETLWRQTSQQLLALSE